MKKLYLIRHAKSSWKDITLSDHDRPLNKRGQKDAPFMAKLLKSKNIEPNLLLTSPALRAKTTAEIFNDTFNTKLLVDDNLYHPTLGQLEDTITKLNNLSDTVFLFSHNPTLNEFVEDHLDIYDNIPTTGVLGISFDTDDWASAFKSDIKLLMFDFPKNYKR